MCAAVAMPGDISSQSSLPPTAGPRVTFDRPCLARSAGPRKPLTLNIDTSLACDKGGGPHKHPPFPRTPPPWLAKRRLSIPPSSPARRRSRDKAAQPDGPRGSHSARIRSSVSAAFRRPPSSVGHGSGSREKREDDGPRRPLGCGEEGRRAEDEDYATANLSLQSTASSAATAYSTDTAARFTDDAQPRPGRSSWRRRWWS
ncbi:hypothetical protein RB595_006092 [Gaeumannomyces hyphopodioides]